MKKTINVGLMSLFLAMGISRVLAQPKAGGDPIVLIHVWDQPLTFTLGAVLQAGTNTVREGLATAGNLIALMSSQTITNPDTTVVTTPNFTLMSNPSLHRLVTIEGTNQSTTFEVKNRGTNVAEVTGFFTTTSDTNTVTHTRLGKTTTWSLDDLYFVTPLGTKIRFAGLHAATSGPLFRGTNELASSILIGSTNHVGFAGIVNGPTGGGYSTGGPENVAGRGTIVVGAGHLDE